MVDYFVSDVHLAAERPRVSDLFLRFCDHAARDAKRLFLVGDIFDLWVGRKQEKLPYVVPILDRLRAIAADGIEVTYIAGNRDFNFDAALAPGAEPAPLPDSMTVESAGRQLYLTHGDLLCTGDVAYGRARSVLRSGPLRAAASHFPLGFTTFMSTGYRRLSERETARKTRLEIAVNFGRVRAHLLAGHDVVVSGHVHRAARYEVKLPEGRMGEFITLGEWHRRGTYLEARGNELNLRVFG
ncbi:MAG: UDP-2,3-diacylglucosamine diphosphatase [Planctomycetota bacterium]|jgi:UDP-2,3-diacylglucosamine hydrolase